MMHSDLIIQEYLEANAEKRLHLFLECPALRNEFMEIDLNECRRTTKANQSRGIVAQKFFPWRWLTAIGNCCLKLKRS